MIAMVKNPRYKLLLFFACILVFSGCAKRGTPDGGPIDVTPPEFIRASPENFSINFDEKEIEIFFDEYVRLEEAQRQIIFSPPMELRPAITPLGAPSKSIDVEIFDTLQPNTTYTINFGRSIVDNNEGNPLPFFQYVFSTGDYIDSLSISGTVSDARLKQPEPFISVMLYEVDSSYTDSAVYNYPPRYITNTLDSSVTFQLNNLKEGTYQLIALKDNNNNYMFEPGVDKIGFLEDDIEIPTDSVFDVTLFKEELPFSVLPRPEQVAQQHLIFGFTGEKPDSLQIRMLPPIPGNFESTITKERDKDTLNYWYKPALERDSLYFTVTTPQYTDTLIARISPMEKDSLQISIEPTGTLNFEQKVSILPNIPLTGINDSLISLINSDTVAVPFETQYNDYLNVISFGFEKQENEIYRFQALPGAFTDFFGNVNDTINAEFRTLTVSDYGGINFNILNIPSHPVIVQLTTEDGEVV
ncbi:MAG TPA: Ig-like domain-containing protein, partial [Salinimicrobium sp.]|nr:Ig-like domain-containing protein [Salinimicrobium sp.]